MSPEQEEVKENERNFKLGIMGCMASGKSTLADICGNRWDNSEIIRERYKINPYLEKFYKDQKRFSFHSQIWFILDNMDQASVSKPTTSLIYDPPLDMHKIYATTHHQMGWMNDEEWEIYNTIYDTLKETKKIQDPDLIIITKTPVNILLERIKKRGRLFEADIEEKYINLLSQNVNDWQDEKKESIPVMEIDTSYYDYTSNDGMNNVGGWVDGRVALLVSENFKNDREYGCKVRIPDFKYKPPCITDSVSGLYLHR